MWNIQRYEQVKAKCKSDIDCGRKSAFDYMYEYKKMIAAEDYEAAKAITEVLAPLHYWTADTHKHIKELQ
jgi:hypothetical protein